MLCKVQTVAKKVLNTEKCPYVVNVLHGQTPEPALQMVDKWLNFLVAEFTPLQDHHSSGDSVI